MRQRAGASKTNSDELFIDWDDDILLVEDIDLTCPLTDALVSLRSTTKRRYMFYRAQEGQYSQLRTQFLVEERVEQMNVVCQFRVLL